MAVLVGFSTTSCKEQDVVVASYRGGRIMMSEFRLFYKLIHDSRRGRPDLHKHARKIGSVKEQSQVLLQLVDIRLGASAARAAGLEKSPEFLARKRALELRTAVEALSQRSLQFHDERPYYLMDLQRLYLRGNHATNAVSPARVRQVLATLNRLKGKALDDYISRHTELKGNRQTAGRLVAICASCSIPVFQFLIKAIERVPPGEFAHVGGVAEGSWFVRSMGGRLLPESAIESYYRKRLADQARRVRAYHAAAGTKPQGDFVPLTDAKMKRNARLNAAFLRRSWKRDPAGATFLAVTIDLARKHKFQLHAAARAAEIGRLPAKQELFSIDGKPYHAAELDALAPLRYFHPRLRAQVLASIYLDRLWSGQRAHQGLRQSPEYRIRLRLRTDETLAREYLDREVRHVKVGRSEALRSYLREKRLGSQLPPFGRIADSYARDLGHRKRHALVEQVHLGLRRKYSVRLHRKLLKATKDAHGH